MKTITVKLLLLLIFFTCFSCNKEKEEVNPISLDERLIKDARTRFDAYLNESTIAETNTTNAIGRTGKIVHWKNARVSQTRVGNVIFVPVSFTNSLSYKQAGKYQRLDVNAYLVMHNNNQNEESIELVTLIPENNTGIYENKKPFYGDIQIRNWQGNNIKTFKLKKDKKLISRHAIYSDDKQVNSSSNEIALNGVETYCYTVDYYYYTSEYPPVWSFSERECFTIFTNDPEHNLKPEEYLIGLGGDGGGGSAGSSSSASAAFVASIDDTKLKPCMQTIMSRVKGISQGVGQIVTKFAGNTPGFKWEVKDGVTNNPNQNAYTDAAYDRINQVVTTTFDSNKFSNASDLSVARTILHESVHAYLVAYFNVDPLNANVSYSQLVQDWNSQKRPDLNALQHDEMTRSFVFDIGLALQEYGQLRNYNYSLQFYQDLAWGGLENTSAFKNLSFADRQRISNVILVELTGKNTSGQAQTQNGSPSGC